MRIKKYTECNNPGRDTSVESNIDSYGKEYEINSQAINYVQGVEEKTQAKDFEASGDTVKLNDNTSQTLRQK